MTICGGQRDALRNTIPKTNFRRDAGPSTALAGYPPVGGRRVSDQFFVDRSLLFQPNIDGIRSREASWPARHRISWPCAQRRRP